MDVTCNNIHTIKEFYGGYHGTCTQTSAAMCLASALGTPGDHDGVVNLMLKMTAEMIQAHEAASNGAATVANMATEIQRMADELVPGSGAHILTKVDTYQEPLTDDWHTAIKDALSHGRPVLLQISRASNLYDQHGMHEDAGVQYHAIALLGINDAPDKGYLVGDPNNPTVEAGFDWYPFNALAAAVPCGLIVFAPYTAPVPPGPTLQEQLDAANARIAHLQSGVDSVIATLKGL